MFAFLVCIFTILSIIFWFFIISSSIPIVDSRGKKSRFFGVLRSSSIFPICVDPTDDTFSKPFKKRGKIINN